MATPTRDPGVRPDFHTVLVAARLLWRSAPVAMLAYLVVTLAGGVTPIVVAWLTKLALDRLAGPGTAAALTGLAAGLAVAGLVTSVTPQFGQYLRAEVNRRASLRAKDDLFAAVERFEGLSRFEDPAFLDRLRFAQQSTGVLSMLVDSCFGLVRGTVTLVGFVGSLAVVNPVFTAVALAAAVPALFVELRLSRTRAEVLWRIGPAERREMFYGHLLSTVDAAKEIRLLGLGAFLRGRMMDEARTSNAARRRLDRRELAAQAALALLAAGIAGGGLVWVLASAGDGRLSVGDVSMFVAAVAGVQGAVAGLVSTAAILHQQLLLFCHYVEVVKAGSDLPVPAVPRALPPLRRGIELRDVWFRYSDEHPWVLRGVNLFVPYGQAVALVGHNGGGKSTLVKLLCRFYDPTRGAILWDGVDIRRVDPRSLRERMGVVFQDFMSYDFSAADNIAVGDLSALGDERRVETAARQAGAHDAVMALPRGYQTLLTRMFRSDGDDQASGVSLSGGQWQRLALARAFLRQDRDLMILDEPSAGLDAEAEHQMHARLHKIRSGRTGILISHRLGTVREADLIAVLADGVIAEQGGHAGLLARGGTYARLFTLQAAGYTGSPPPRLPARE